MAIPIPAYLKDIVSIERDNKNYIFLNVVCCLSSKFQVYINKVNKTEAQKHQEKEINDFQKRSAWHSVYVEQLEDGQLYMVRKNIFGKIVDKALMPKDIDNTKIIKVKCAKCGKEIILFDNRIYGYDAFVAENKKNCSYNGIEFAQKKFNGSKDNLADISVKIFNDATLEEFIEYTGEQASEKEYSNAFSYITIYGIIKDINNKKITIYSEETA